MSLTSEPDTHRPCIPNTVPVEPEITGGPENRWHACHTKPRREKRLAAAFARAGVDHYLPLVPSLRNYGPRTRQFDIPLFPGYLFARICVTNPMRTDQLEHLVRRIPVEDESRFLKQMDVVRRTVESGLSVSRHPMLRRGTRVRVTAGPLRGIEGVVDDPANPKGVIISVDLLQQGVMVLVAPEALKLLPE